jgi:hypothetical protein
LIGKLKLFEYNSIFSNRRHHLNTFDNNESKSLDRNMGNSKIDAKQTIMTAHEPEYSHQKLEFIYSNRKDMVNNHSN